MANENENVILFTHKDFEIFPSSLVTTVTVLKSPFLAIKLACSCEQPNPGEQT